MSEQLSLWDDDVADNDETGSDVIEVELPDALEELSDPAEGVRDIVHEDVAE